MSYNFDEAINRYNSDSVKYDTIAREYKSKDILGMRIADSDFATPKPILDALQERLDHRVIGYGEASEKLYNNIISFYERNAKWTILPTWINFTPGIVPILGVSLISLTQPGDEILTQTPGYPPLSKTVVANNRKLVTSELIYDQKTGDYMMDFEDLQSKVTDKTRFFLLCNPHNPTGKVWKRTDLEQLGEFCLKNKILILSDEIHGFLNYEEFPYTPMASISPEIAQITISCFSPGKLFDIPGSVFAFSVIPNKEIREKFFQGLIATGAIYAYRNLLGLTVLKASYVKENEEWLKEKLVYLQKNAIMVDEFFKANLPQIISTPNEGTFLKWINFSHYGLSEQELQTKLINEAKVALLPGNDFGNNLSGFCRMNIGCTQLTLKTALSRIYNAFREIN